MAVMKRWRSTMSISGGDSRKLFDTINSRNRKISRNRQGYKSSKSFGNLNLNNVTSKRPNTVRGNNNPRASTSGMRNMFESVDETTSEVHINFAKEGGIDRSDWLNRALANDPSLKDIRERMIPINRVASFSRTYNRGRHRGIISDETAVSLVLQYLEKEGFLEARRILEEESGILFEGKTKDNRLTTLIKIALSKIENLYNLTLDEQSKDDCYQDKIKRELNSLELLRQDLRRADVGVNIWEENVEGNIICVSPDGDEHVGEQLEDYTIKAASLNQILKMATPNKPPDRTFVHTVLLTYNSFTTPEVFLQKLIQRYKVPEEPGFTEEELKQRSLPIQLRVMAVMKRWRSTMSISGGDSRKLFDTINSRNRKISRNRQGYKSSKSFGNLNLNNVTSKRPNTVRGNNNPRASTSGMRNMFESVDETTSEVHINFAKEGGIDRSDWLNRALANDPSLKDIRERMIPINRVASFSRTYNRGRHRGIISDETAVSLVLQYLEKEGFLEARRILEEESGILFEGKTKDNRLTTLIKIALSKIENLYNLTLDEQSKDDCYQDKIKRELNSLELLRQDLRRADVGVNIWEENVEGNIICVSPDGDEHVGEQLEDYTIKAASLNQILKMATPNKPPDRTFVHTVLLTYNSFTTPEVFLQKLIQRYKVPEEPGFTEEELKQRSLPIQLRVMAVMKRWIEDYLDDVSDSVCYSIREFISTTVALHQPGQAKSVTTLLDTQLEQRKLGTGKQMLFDFTAATPPPEVPPNVFLPNLKWYDVHVIEIARQLTLIDFQMFFNIKSSEFLDQSWSRPALKHRAPNILKATERFNNIALWVANVILTENNFKKRVKIFSTLLSICEHLISLNSFNTLLAFSAGFNHASISRLKHTIDALPERAVETWNHTKEILDSESLFTNYRKVLEATVPPVIPYLGVFLTDLTFIEDANPDTYNGLINFKKRELIGRTIQIIQRYQQTGYNLQPVYQIQKLFEDIPLTYTQDTEMYKASLVIEPRNATKSDLK
eukprot:TRINITY_DN7785_c0_g1_i1.p1 TRINITY_DN7785_c0_g1~~TRINITY_DN7785_c0_g1_i1.p1  ORF type:complete len:1010 (+),score=231.89 TRINITY_DN7785_c0_g1_i1:2-3031(+)